MTTDTRDRPVRADDMENLIDRLIERLGHELVVGLPLGLGKPNRLVNALYQRAHKDASLDLTLLTALSLEVPPKGSGLQARLAGPILERLYAGYPALDYMSDLRAGKLPDNVRVQEFFFTPASLLNVEAAQRGYLASNYTHAARDIFDRGCNVILQMVVKEGARYSLSCNPDVTLDAVAALRASGRPHAMVGQVHRDLPFMEGSAVVAADYFDYLLEEPAEDFTLFATPRPRVSDREHRIGLYASALIKDGGTLQIGIGALGDALVYALVLRQQYNRLYQEMMKRLKVPGAFDQIAQRLGGVETFAQGLYGCSEMLVDGFLKLIEAGIIKREVYSDPELQRKANAGEPVDASGVILHGGFFLGPADFYQTLRDLSPEARHRIHMESVSMTNQLLGNEAARSAQRKDARFVNSCIKVTLMGEVVSDGFEDGRVLSGVGGQYNFVDQAHSLPGGRSIILARSTYGHGRHLESNIVWNYANCTIPRHLRDLVVTEYGIAELRGQSDEECIQALICIADGRFQQSLRKQAVQAGKLSKHWRIPSEFCNNTPKRIEDEMTECRGVDPFPDYPFGSELSDTEQVLVKALEGLQQALGDSRLKFTVLVKTLWQGEPADAASPYLERMNLSEPATLRDRFYQRLLAGALRKSIKEPT